MIKIITATLLCFSIFCVQGCKKQSDTSTSGGTPLSGGKGGSAALTITPEHHGQFVDSCMIYIKYGTNDAPVNGVYDDSAKCFLNDTTPIAIFTNLKAGSYYLYADGFHAGYVPPYVKGGLPHNIVKETDSDTFFLPTYSYNR